MPIEKAPAFQFYVNDWRGSRRVQRMTFEERGMYLEMLIEQWEKGSLPDSVEAVAAELGGPLARWNRAWDALRACFVLRPRDGRLVNEKMEDVRRGLKKYVKAQSVSGLKGATERWRRHRVAINRHSDSMANHSSLSSSSTSSSTSSASSSAVRPPNSNGSKRPIFSGQRFTVFEWQLDALSRLLGPHFESFDLHAWFFALDGQVVQALEVVPQRDGGAWLLARTEAEAKRRGLIIASTRKRLTEDAATMDAGVLAILKKQGVIQ